MCRVISTERKQIVRDEATSFHSIQFLFFPASFNAWPKVYGSFNEHGRRRKSTVCRLTKGRAKVREMVVITGTTV